MGFFQVFDLLQPCWPSADVAAIEVLSHPSLCANATGAVHDYQLHN